MEYRRLGASDLRVSTIGMGCWQLAESDYWGPGGESAEDVVAAAVDMGVNLFDTAESYVGGESEKILGRALGAARENVYIATKVTAEHCAPASVREACEGSLCRLGTDRIDLYQVHWPSRDVPFEDTYAEMKKLQEEGKIRHIGVSNFGAVDLTAWMKKGKAVSDQLGYNLLFRAIEYDVVPACERFDVGIIVYMGLLQGILAARWKSVEEVPQARRRTRHFSSDREGPRHDEPGAEALTFQTLRRLEEAAAEMGEPMAHVALSWLLGKPGVTTVIAGARRVSHVARNVDAGSLKLSSEFIARLNGITADLKDALGPNPDLWLGSSESRIR